VDDQITSPVDTNGLIFFNAGDSVVTNDPGLALITGKCKHVGSRTVPSLRALAAHEPFFSNGSAPKLDDVVKFYNKRFSIGLTLQERTDLVNFLEAL
jgi:cytochrome c peroxidase